MHGDGRGRAEDVEAFHQDQVGRQLVGVAVAAGDQRGRGPPDDHDAGAEGRAADRLHRGGAADGVVNDVDAAAAARRPQVVAEAPRTGVVLDPQQGARPVVTEGRELGLAATGGDHDGAEEVGELDRGEAGAPGGAEHEHTLAGLHLGAVDERVVGGLVAAEEAGALVVRERGGQREDGARGGDGVAGEPAEATVGAE